MSLESEDLRGTSSGNDITQDTSCTTKTSNIRRVYWLKDVNICMVCVCLQDSQTDSGMVLASDELERFEHKHRGAMLKK